MVVFPNCKINLGLKVLRKRADGFHDLETVFYPLPFYDVLEVVQSPAFSFTQTGHTLAIADSDNICVKAWQLLKTDHPSLPEVSIHLHKNIPAGAGLGGGSADAAFLLQLVDRKFRLGISEHKLADYALQLGSDCPFFLMNKPAIATGRGEQLEEINLDLLRYKLVIVNPGIHVHTGLAFSMFALRADDTASDRAELNTVISQPPTSWKGNLVNDFEAPVFEKFPEIAQVRDRFYSNGAIYAAMSGTGSTVFAIFEKGRDIPSFPAHYLVKEF